MNLCPSGCQQVLSRIPFDWGESTREGGWSMAREIWSTDFVTDSRTGTDGPLWWGESAQEGCQRTLSRTRGRERTVRFGWGESTREGCQRTASRHRLADGNGRSALRGGESTREGCQRTLSRTRGRERTESALAPVHAVNEHGRGGGAGVAQRMGNG